MSRKARNEPKPTPWWVGVILAWLIASAAACGADESTVRSDGDHSEMSVVVVLDEHLYRVTNQSNETASLSVFPMIDEKVGGSWVAVIGGEGRPRVASSRILEPDRSFEYRVPELADLPPGSYRARVVYGLGQDAPDKTASAEFKIGSN